MHKDKYPSKLVPPILAGLKWMSKKVVAIPLLTPHDASLVQL